MGQRGDVYKRQPASYANILTAGSVEAVNTANNHSHDYGEESFNDTLKALDTANILHFGYDETAVTEVKGVKVGLVGILSLIHILPTCTPALPETTIIAASAALTASSTSPTKSKYPGVSSTLIFTLSHGTGISVVEIEKMCIRDSLH